MLGRLSRASSHNSLNDGDRTTPPPPGPRNLTSPPPTMRNMDQGRDHIQSIDLDPALLASINFTREHPIGAILVKLAQDNTALARKANLRGVETNINDLCTSFHTAVQLEKNELQKQLAKKHEDIESSLINKDLNSHHINSAIQPPRNFSEIPTITSPSKLSEILKIFPRNMKFSGTKQDSNMSIIEFLNTLKTAQDQAQLSVEEFLDRMLACSTGLAHELILEWKNNGEDIPTIYHNLLVNFDKRLAPEDAKSQLNTYKVPKSHTLAKAESQIMVLAGRIASALPEGPSRAAYYNLEACNAIIRALPPASSSNVNNLYNQISARLGRAATFAELSRAMNLYRVTIDKDIRQNGGDNILRSKRIQQSNSRVINQKFRPKFTTYNVNSQLGNIPRQSFSGQKVHYNNNNYKGSYNNNISFTPRPINVKPLINKFNGQNKSNDDKRVGNKFRQTSKQAPNNKFQKFKSNTSNSCSLCGMKNHRSKDCRNMQDDQGKRIDIIPTYGTCSQCPFRVQPRLHHPEALCPFRVGGPLYGKLPSQ